MIPEIGHYALVLALMLALVQGLVPLYGAALGDRALMELGRTTALGQLGLVALAFACLVASFVTSDFSVAAVALNSHTAKPLAYKIAGAWGHHEGSLLLWVLMLALFGALVAVFGRGLPQGLRARTLSVQALIAAGFLGFILFTSNPFARIWPAPAEGNGLNPLLQDPGLVVHPPMLYLGYVGFSIVFSFAVAALIEGRVDAAWARWVRPWTLASWTALTGGIALGSAWAYYELGWGGFWFWDPVENASFMPWLSGTALLHSAIVSEKRDTLKSWTILLAIVTFSLSLVGTFLVRSGVLTSVHAFATDPARGVFILALIVAAVGGSLALYAWRVPGFRPGGLFRPLSREGALVLNNLLLATALATVFVGTFYPLALDALTGQKISVGPPYYAATFVPLMVPLVIVMGVGPLLAWKRSDLGPALAALKGAAGVTVLITIGVVSWIDAATALSALGAGLGVWLATAAVAELLGRLRLFREPLAASLGRARRTPRAAWGMTLAHGGLGVAILGIVATTAWSAEGQAIVRPGEGVAVAGRTFVLDRVRTVAGPNYKAHRATVRVMRGGRTLAILEPEIRDYSAPATRTTEAAIRPSVLDDLYAVVGEGDDKAGYTVRFYVKPLVSWIWAGAVLMMAGGILSLSDRRYRVGAARERARRALGPKGVSLAGPAHARADRS